MFEVCKISKNEDNKHHYRGIEGILYYVFTNGKKRCKLYSCNAEICECSGILILVSYGTPIAVFAPDDGSLYDCLRVVYGYTATSAKHISKFEKWLSENNYHVKYSVRFKN